MTHEQTFEISAVAKQLSVRYQILRPIGKSRCSVVYLALDQFERRKVAIKVARLDDTQNDGGELHKLWLTEVRSASHLKHPFITNTYEAGLMKEDGYTVMEYLSGGTLEPFIQPENLLPIERVVEILFKICKAFEYVYSIGILHLNIKPRNILFNQKGDVKVSDFGSCYQLKGDDTQAYEEGSLEYAPPEHFKNTSPDVRFDIYALGVIAYQLLTGHSPYLGGCAEMMSLQKINDDPKPLSEWCLNIPAKLSEIVLKAIARDPAHRYSEWTEFSDDLENALSASPDSKGIANESTDNFKNEIAQYASLAKLDFFREFDQNELWETVQISHWIRCTPGELIVTEGSSDSNIFVILLGEARVLKGKVILNHMKQGSCFGELAYLDRKSQLRTANVVAFTMLVVLIIDGESLRKSSDRLQTRFSGAFLRAMIGKITQSDKRIITLTEKLKSIIK